MPKNYDEDIKFFIDRFKESIKKIDKNYFKLPYADMDSEEKEVYLERVYCYELYHQLRLSLSGCFDYIVNGEVNKSHHDIIESDKMPDFIVHKTNQMKDNLVIIEVKRLHDINLSENSSSGFIKDMETLNLFVNEYNYKKGIQLIFGKNESLKMKKVVDKFEYKTPDNDIDLIWNKEPGEIIHGANDIYDYLKIS